MLQGICICMDTANSVVIQAEYIYSELFTRCNMYYCSIHVNVSKLDKNHH